MKSAETTRDLDRLFSHAWSSEPELVAERFTEALSKEIRHRQVNFGRMRSLILSLGIVAGFLIFYLVFPWSQILQLFFQTLSYASPAMFLTSLLVASAAGIFVSLGALWIIDGADDIRGFQ